jgi:hypothetical protein
VRWGACGQGGIILWERERERERERDGERGRQVGREGKGRIGIGVSAWCKGRR